MESLSFYRPTLSKQRISSPSTEVLQDLFSMFSSLWPKLIHQTQSTWRVFDFWNFCFSFFAPKTLRFGDGFFSLIYVLLAGFWRLPPPKSHRNSHKISPPLCSQCPPRGQRWRLLILRATPGITQPWRRYDWKTGVIDISKNHLILY